MTTTLLQAAQNALAADENIYLLEPLFRMLKQRTTPAHNIIQTFQNTGSIEDTLHQTYPSLVSPSLTI